MNKKLSALLAATLVTAFSLQAQNLTDAQKIAADAAAAISNAPKQDASLAQKPKYWKNSLTTKIDFGQTSLTNWAAGGYNSYSLKAYVDANANYAKDDMVWTNRLQLDYGFLYSADKPVLQKSDDRIYLESKWGYKAVEKLYLSAQYNFKSQFSTTYEYPVPKTDANGNAFADGVEPGREDWKNARVLKSGFLSPAYTNLALGLDYNPLKWLSINFAPLTGGFVIVTMPEIRSAYGMKVKKGREDLAELTGEDYRSAKFEFGAQLKIDVKVNVNDNFKYTSQILLFSDYLDTPQNIRVNWDNRVEWKLAKYFSLMFTTNLIYDDKVMITSEKDIDKFPNGRQRIQFKESLSFGFVYTIASKS
ncbi:MAG: DUF3078 domain-containing protein [Candidatus Cryptobacteroides sp.]